MAKQTAKKQLFERERHFKPGRVFMAKDFLDIGNRGAVDMALSALAREGKIRRIQRGLYDLPKRNPKLGGVLSVDVDQAARALARRFHWTIVPEGAWAANLLGLSTQVPAKIVYLSDGPNKKVQLGRRLLHFKHARPHVLGEHGGKSALVIEALRNAGKEDVDDEVVLRLQTLLSDPEKRRLVKATRFGVESIDEAAKKIARKPIRIESLSLTPWYAPNSSRRPRTGLGFPILSSRKIFGSAGYSISSSRLRNSKGGCYSKAEHRSRKCLAR